MRIAHIVFWGGCCLLAFRGGAIAADDDVFDVNHQDRQATIKGIMSDASSIPNGVTNVWVRLESEHLTNETRRDYYNVPVTGTGTQRQFQVDDVYLCGTNTATVWLPAKNEWSNIGLTNFQASADDLKVSLKWTATMYQLDDSVLFRREARLKVIGPTDDSSTNVTKSSTSTDDNNATGNCRGIKSKRGCTKYTGTTTIKFMITPTRILVRHDVRNDIRRIFTH